MTAAVIGANASYLALAFLPPILWLIFYLREDRHPEPKRLILLAFIGGIFAAGASLVAECAWVSFFSSGSCTSGIQFSFNPIILFLGIALIEEYAKYLSVKIAILRRPNFDEPVDAMIYMITAAMGFAALENLLFLLPILHRSASIGIEITANRFLGANLLHALSSGLVGFFLARAFFSPRRHHFIALGIIIATLLHTLFNYLILIREGATQATLLIVLLLTLMAVMVFIDFERLKRSRVNPEPSNHE